MEIPSPDIGSLIRTSYDSTADLYANYADPLVFRLVAQPLLKNLKPFPGPVLDVASGAGALGRYLEPCIALDLSADQLRKNPMNQRVQADAERLPFQNDSFAVAACAFGINHFLHPEDAIREMARVARVVGLSTWQRPEEPYQPKQIVQQLIKLYENGDQPPVSSAVARMTEAIGSVDAIGRAVRDAGLDAIVRTAVVDVPWPGAERFVDYRLSLPTGSSACNRQEIKRDAVAALSRLDPESLHWQPRVIVALGQRSSS
jgi:ubiquinone/menaquinone biosynthesis C-methylase UbiE